MLSLVLPIPQGQYIFKILFIYFWLCWVFLAAQGLFSSCGEQGLLSSCCVRASGLQWLLLLQGMGSRACGLQKLQHMGSVVGLPGPRAQAQ